MPTEKQIIAILTVIGSFAAMGFAIYNLYENFKPNNATAKLLAQIQQLKEKETKY